MLGQDEVGVGGLAGDDLVSEVPGHHWQPHSAHCPARGTRRDRSEARGTRRDRIGGELIRLSRGVKYSYIAVWQNIYLYFCLLFTEINEEHKIFINVAISNLLDGIIT